MKRVPQQGIVGIVALREAAATDMNQIITLVRSALQAKLKAETVAANPRDPSPYVYVDIDAVYPDSVVVCMEGRHWKYPYTLGADNVVTIGEKAEVTEQFVPVRESADPAAAVAIVMGDPATCMFLEAKQADGSKWGVVIIRAGESANKIVYPDAVLREAAPRFEGARVFAKSDIAHFKGDESAKDVRNIVGWIADVAFVEGKTPDTGYLGGTLNLTAGAEPLRATILDAWQRGKRDLVGLSIDAIGTATTAMRESRRVKVAKSITKVNSVDLIVEAGAGGGLVRLVEAADPSSGSNDMSLKQLMLDAIKAKKPEVAATINIDTITDEALAAAYREAHAPAAVSLAAGNEVVTNEQLESRVRMIEARAEARIAIAGSTLPQAAKDKLNADFSARTTFTGADVTAAIDAERAYVARFTESGRVQMGGLSADITVGDRAAVVQEMLTAFFDPAHKDHGRVHSFKECYIEITGDRRVTGRMENVDRTRLAESLGANFRESLDSTSFADALGTSITRRMVAEFRAAVEYDGWRQICNVVPVTDFRTQDRVNIGGYGDLPTVNQGSAYAALTSPTDEKATYSIAKKGGTEDVTMEMIKNDDVGAIRMIPVKLGRAAKRTLAKFVFDFIKTNPAIYDSVALFHADHGNLGTTAFSATEFGVVRVAMMKQAERDSSDRLGIGPAGILCPVDLQETVWNAFQRSTNNDKTFIQSMTPTIIPVWYWTDANDWAAYANPLDIPGLEIGFLDGQQEPELFVQDMPNVGSMFSNDKLTYKIRHIYGGAIVPDGYKAFYKETVS